MLIYSKDNKHIAKRCLYPIWNWCPYVWRISRFNYNGKRWNTAYAQLNYYIILFWLVKLKRVERLNIKCQIIQWKRNIIFSVQKEMNKIWDQAERTGYVMARCGDTNLTDEDIISLKGNNWLTDQVKIYKIY